MNITIRGVLATDAQSIVNIFNYFIKNSFAAFPETEKDISVFQRFVDASKDLPFYVVENEKKEIFGFGFCQKFRNEETLRRTVELTYFILPHYTRNGIGTRLLQKLEADARQKNVCTLLANINSLNEQSLNFHKKQGFEICGCFKDVGVKWGKKFDMVWMQKHL